MLKFIKPQKFGVIVFKFFIYIDWINFNPDIMTESIYERASKENFCCFS